jgi:hypothetical protein
MHMYKKSPQNWPFLVGVGLILRGVLTSKFYGIMLVRVHVQHASSSMTYRVRRIEDVYPVTLSKRSMHTARSRES